MVLLAIRKPSSSACLTFNLKLVLIGRALGLVRIPLCDSVDPIFRSFLGGLTWSKTNLISPLKSRGVKRGSAACAGGVMVATARPKQKALRVVMRDVVMADSPFFWLGPGNGPDRIVLSS